MYETQAVPLQMQGGKVNCVRAGVCIVFRILGVFAVSPPRSLTACVAAKLCSLLSFLRVLVLVVVAVLKCVRAH